VWGPLLVMLQRITRLEFVFDSLLSWI
jgi:hypothetical protein